MKNKKHLLLLLALPLTTVMFLKAIVLNSILLTIILIPAYSQAILKNDSIDGIESIDDLPNLEIPTYGTGDNCIDSETILSLITPASNSDENPPIINIVNFLKHDLYKSTAGPVIRRSLLDEPSLQPYLFGETCGWNFNAQPFFNETPKMLFTEKSPYLSSYIDLSNKNIFKEIDLAIKGEEELEGESKFNANQIDIPNVLSLVKPIKLRQYRTGVFFDFDHTSDQFYISWRIPFYYLAEHFHLTDKEIDRIKTAPFLTTGEPTDFDMGTEELTETFVRRHLLTDKLGFGDSRFIVLYSPYNTTKATLWLGFQATLPTAAKVASGLSGEEINFYAKMPELDIKSLFNLALCTDGIGEKREANRKISRNLQSFLVEGLDRLTTILIDAPLGNGKHVGLGPQIDFTYDFNSCWNTHGTAIIEGFLPHKERRFFIKLPKERDFKRNFRDPDHADQNLNLINKLAIETLFPTPLYVSVRPGYLVKIRQLIRYESNFLNGSLGLDYWRQSHEHFLNISPELYKKYAIKKALHKPAEQIKLYGSLGIKGANNIYLWHTLLTADYAIYNRGIGRGFIVGVQAGIDF